ncbi:MAG: GDP-mannose 4,6-dehydratase [Prolixibacteraceae bacterium]|jgi:UDP-glucuronate 4-epimerase|nr:GDP-mannose 4,6-dehydratase [Prolixibacteraceae bacterium]
MKTILVTGCAGFIGSHLTEKLLAENYQVFGIDNFDPFYNISIKKQNLSNFIHHPNFTFLEEDLTKDFESKLPEGIELVIHLAGKAGVRPSIEDPSSYIENNINATQNVLNMMKNKGIGKMAFASSSSVYGNTKETPFTEKMDVTNPISPYAATKKACELINHTAHHLHKIDIINMRFFTVFGPRQRPDLAIHKFTKLIREGKEITMFGDGSTARDYTYVDDTISGIMGAVNYLFENENVYETVNLGNNHPIVLKDMIQIIYQATGEKTNIRQLPMQAGDVDITFADISKAQRLFNYKPQFNFEEGIRHFIDWYDDSISH